MISSNLVFRATNRLSNRYHRVRSLLLYGWSMGSFGRGSVIRNPLLIENPRQIHIGERVFIRDGVRLEVVFSRPDRIPILTIGSDTNIEQNVHIVCHHEVAIGRGVSITGECAIVDVSHRFSGLAPGAKAGDLIEDDDASVRIDDGVFIGFGAIILPNVHIGCNAIVGANAVVVQDVPPDAVVAGVPAKVIGTRGQISVGGKRSVKEQTCAAESQ